MKLNRKQKLSLRTWIDRNIVHNIPLILFLSTVAGFFAIYQIFKFIGFAIVE